MKKITIYSLHLGYGGIESTIRSLANNICDDYEVEIVAIYKLYDKEVVELNNKIKIKYLINDDIALRVDKYKKDIKSLKIIGLFKDLFKEYKLNIFRLAKDTINSGLTVIKKKKSVINDMKNNDADIVITTRVELNDYASKYIKGKAYKIAWEHNHHHNNMEYAKKVVNSCSNMDTLVLVSDSLRNFYKKMMKDNNNKCKCVYIPNMLNYIPDKVSDLKENNFVSVGRFSKEKGFVDLIEVIHRFKEKYPDTKFHLDLVGDGSEKNKIIDKIYSYGLIENIKVHGFLDREGINKILEKSSIYLMTSYTESFGIVLIEAMSYGVPCIAFASAEGANDLITNDHNGYLISNRSYDDMVDKMKKLLDDSKKRKVLGKNARECSLKYDSNNIKQEWLDLLKRKD